jgi:hypothetical protein
MPITIRLGLSKKIGQPDFGSLGASCNVEFEASSGLLEDDLETSNRQVRNAYVACRQAVQDELAHDHSARAYPFRIYLKSPLAANGGIG